MTTNHRQSSQPSTPTSRPVRVAARRAGYVAGAVVNAVLLYVANHLLEWEWPPFLTREFATILPLVNASIVLGIVTNFAYLFDDRVRVKALGESVSAAVGLAVAIRMYQVFPFDLSPYDFDWETTARAVLVIAMVGTGVAIIVNGVRLVAGAAEPRSKRHRAM